MDQQKIGDYLRQLRIEKNLTQGQLAEKFNTTNRSVSRWENGKNLPDISLLLDLADFYNVDIREILDGESKGNNANTDIKDAAAKIADYTGTEQSKLLTWIRCISLIGVVLMVGVLALQTFTYEPGILAFTCYTLCLLAFMAMAILALYTNGLLNKLTKNRKFVTACKIIVIALSSAVLFFIIRIIFVIFLVVFAESTPPQKLHGIENYDKSYYLTTYSGDLDTGMFIFPDSTENMLNPTFDSNLKTGLFDTDGYIILQAEYTEEKYQAEIERLSSLECSITYNGETVTQQIRYDENSYSMPAYVTVDGFDNVYEYALIDDANNTIIYILLSYPNPLSLSKYSDYLKTDITAYNISDALNQFTIYAHSFDGGDSWIEYSDTVY